MNYVNFSKTVTKKKQKKTTQKTCYQKNYSIYFKFNFRKEYQYGWLYDSYNNYCQAINNSL